MHVPRCRLALLKNHIYVALSSGGHSLPFFREDKDSNKDKQMVSLKQYCSFRKAAAKGGQAEKIVNLLRSPDRLQRLQILLKIRYNHLHFDHKPSDVDTVSFEEFLAQLRINDSAFYRIIKDGGEAAEAVRTIRAIFKALTADEDKLPFPAFYNADQSLAILTYGLTRYLKPEFALETGVGYGITSALVLGAMERNSKGKLVSIDLPSLSDPNGSYTGAVVPKRLKDRWTLHLGSSGRFLSKTMSSVERIGLFISDSANVYTLQRYEFESVYPKLRVGGAALFNNIGAKFQGFLESVDGIEFHSIWQVDKPACATGLIFKR